MNSTVASPCVFPFAPSESSAARRVPNFRQPRALGQSAIRSSWASEIRYTLTILTVLMWRWCRRRRWVLMVVLRVWLAGKFFAGLGRAGSFPIRLWAPRRNHFALQPITRLTAAPPKRKLHPALGGGTLVLARPWSRNFSTFFAAAKALWPGLTSCNCNTRQRLTLPTGIDFLPPSQLRRGRIDHRGSNFSYLPKTASVLTCEHGFRPERTWWW